MKLSNHKHQSWFKVTPLNSNWIIAFSVYLILVWGFAILRAQYMWITGDDPNLLVQSILTREGQRPNFDFKSGYPGLSQFTQSLLMKVFGVNLFSQHLYTAILSTITGFLICINFSKSPAWILSTGLIIVYCQEHLVNPTPNPGHLFINIVLFLYTLDKKLQIKNSIMRASLVAFLLGISFLAKQYAIIIFISYIILQISQVKDFKNTRYKNRINLLIGLLVAFSYYYFLIPNSRLKIDALINLVLCSIPFLVLMYLNSKNEFNPGIVRLKELLAIIATSLIVFIFTIFIGLSMLYGTFEINELLRITLFDMPQEINLNLVLIQFSVKSIMQMLSFIIFLVLVLFINFYNNKTNSNKILDAVKILVCIFIAVFIFSQVGNLSANLVISILPTLIIILFFKYLQKDLPKYMPYLFALACYQFVLIPYPNVNFHIAVFIFGLLVLTSTISSFNSNKQISIAMLLPVLLISALLYKENRDMSSMKSFSYSGITFKSSDINWEYEIISASKSGNNIANCSTYGCKFLVLIAK
jgi:hypothetical protein